MEISQIEESKVQGQAQVQAPASVYLQEVNEYLEILVDFIERTVHLIPEEEEQKGQEVKGRETAYSILQELKILKENLEIPPTLDLVMVGASKSGKSTFLNTLLPNKVMKRYIDLFPTDFKEATCVPWFFETDQNIPADHLYIHHINQQGQVKNSKICRNLEEFQLHVKEFYNRSAIGKFLSGEKIEGIYVKYGIPSLLLSNDLKFHTDNDHPHALRIVDIPGINESKSDVLVAHQLRSPAIVVICFNFTTGSLVSDPLLKFLSRLDSNEPVKLILVCTHIKETIIKMIEEEAKDPFEAAGAIENHAAFLHLKDQVENTEFWKEANKNYNAELFYFDPKSSLPDVKNGMDKIRECIKQVYQTSDIKAWREFCILRKLAKLNEELVKVYNQIDKDFRERLQRKKESLDGLFDRISEDMKEEIDKFMNNPYKITGKIRKRINAKFNDFVEDKPNIKTLNNRLNEFLQADVLPRTLERMITRIKKKKLLKKYEQQIEQILKPIQEVLSRNPEAITLGDISAYQSFWSGTVWSLIGSGGLRWAAAEIATSAATTVGGAIGGTTALGLSAAAATFFTGVSIAFLVGGVLYAGIRFLWPNREKCVSEYIEGIPQLLTEIQPRLHPMVVERGLLMIREWKEIIKLAYTEIENKSDEDARDCFLLDAYQIDMTRIKDVLRNVKSRHNILSEQLMRVNQ